MHKTLDTMILLSIVDPSVATLSLATPVLLPSTLLPSCVAAFYVAAPAIIISQISAPNFD